MSTESYNPISTTLKEALCAHFNKSYKDGINPSIANLKLDVKWTSVAPFLDFNNLSDKTDIGVGFFYVLDDSLDYFTYIITLAQRVYLGNNMWDIQAIPHNQSGYFMFTNTASRYKTIPHEQLATYLGKYKNNVSVRIFSNGIPIQVSSIAASHPKVCFFPGKNFYKFITQNIPDLGSSIYDLTIYNGAMYFPNVYNGNAVELQSPIIVAEENDNPLITKNFDFNFPYKNQGLDVGRLCPPDC